MTSLIILMIASAHAGDCANTTASSNADLSSVIAAGMHAFSEMEDALLTSALADAPTFLACLGEPIEPRVAAAYFRLQAIEAFMADDLWLARRTFLAAHRLDPAFELPTSIVPPGHALREPWNSSLLLEIPNGQRVDSAEGDAYVDGSSVGLHAPNLPMILQVVVEGEITGTQYIPPRPDAREEEVSDG